MLLSGTIINNFINNGLLMMWKICTKGLIYKSARVAKLLAANIGGVKLTGVKNTYYNDVFS